MGENNGKTGTSPNPNKLTRFSGTDLLTLGNALNQGAQEIKQNGLRYRIPRDPDFEAFITKTDRFFELIVKAWQAVKLAIREDRDDLNLYSVMDTRTEEEKAQFEQMHAIKPLDKI